MSRTSRSRGFTRIELIVAIAILGVVALLTWPAIRSGLVKRDLARTMSNGRELYLAAFRMATEGAAKSDGSLAWPGDYPVHTLAEYSSKLIQKDYVKPADLQRILSAPGANCTVTTNGSPPTAILSGSSALKVYSVKASDPSNTIFIASTNYIYATELKPDAVPFGDYGFVVVRKSGDADIRKRPQATPAGFESPRKFQTEIGALPGATKGTVTPGDGEALLTPPR